MLIHNFLFIKSFCNSLRNILINSKLVSAVAISQEELVLDFGADGYLQLNFIQGNCFFSYFNQTYFLNKNAKPRFRNLWKSKIVKIQELDFDRAFYFEFEDGKVLYFMLYGRRSNILFFENDSDLPKEVFRFKIEADKSKKLSKLLLKKEIPFSSKIKLSDLKFFDSNIAELLGNPEVGSIGELNSIIENLQTKFVFNKDKGQLETVLGNDSTGSLISELREYFIYSISHFRFDSLKSSLLSEKKSALSKIQGNLKQSQKGRERIVNSREPKELADIIMANLFLFKDSAKENIVDDFYTGEKLKISIPENITAVKYAEKLYKKSQNREGELKRIDERIERLERELIGIESFIEEIDSAENYRDLKSLQRNEINSSQDDELPYFEVIFQKYIIRIGKNAKSNDKLLRFFSSKNDYWLHAKDYSGSHVIIKRENKNEKIPESVVQKAASFAAWFSKARNQNLATVIVTERKFVRKSKSLKPGQVIVDKESTVLVSPEKPYF